MNTVQKNNNITKKQVQELLENNQKKLGCKIFIANATTFF